MRWVAYWKMKSWKMPTPYSPAVSSSMLCETQRARSSGKTSPTKVTVHHHLPSFHEVHRPELAKICYSTPRRSPHHHSCPASKQTVAPIHKPHHLDPQLLNHQLVLPQRRLPARSTTSAEETTTSTPRASSAEQSVQA